MSTLFRLSSIAEILNLPIATDQTIECFLTDSRSLTFPERTLFFAIVTEKGDGHRYIRELYDRGVRAFVISDKDLREDEYPEATFLRVSNTVNALQKIATTHRNVLRMPVIGVTGSNGKTTLKELLYQLLQHRYDVGRSPRATTPPSVYPFLSSALPPLVISLSSKLVSPSPMRCECWSPSSTQR